MWFEAENMKKAYLKRFVGMHLFLGLFQYSEMLLQLQNEHEFELSTLNSWESELDLQKENLETQLNEINGYESAWQKLLMANIKNEFVYGGISGK